MDIDPPQAPSPSQEYSSETERTGDAQDTPSKHTIRIPKEVWNTTPPAPAPHTSSRLPLPPPTEKRLLLKLKLPTQPRSPSYSALIPSPIATPTLEESHTGPQYCKNKIYRWITDAPEQRKPKQNLGEMFLQAPCLAPSCSSCREWHPTLAGGGNDESANFGRETRTSDVEALSPVLERQAKPTS
jgi:hypothetical protein